jgi:hypothetical protein
MGFINPAVPGQCAPAGQARSAAAPQAGSCFLVPGSAGRLIQSAPLLTLPGTYRPVPEKRTVAQLLEVELKLER